LTLATADGLTEPKCRWALLMPSAFRRKYVFGNERLNWCRR
jgi:hypothetical protein